MAKQKCTKCKEKFDIVLCQCCQTKLFVDNGLLMYVSSYSSRAPRLAIKSAVLNFYSSDAVASARQALEDSVKDIISDHPALGVKRTDSVKRTACDAMLDDILDLLGALAGWKVLYYPSLYAVMLAVYHQRDLKMGAV